MIVPVKGVSAMNVDLTGIAEGNPVELVPEPTNPYDPRAIRVEIGGRLIGYLDRQFAARHEAHDYIAAVSLVLSHPETGKPAGLRLQLERQGEVA